jgi:hypothetical protein
MSFKFKLGKKDAKFNPYALRLKNYIDKTYIAPPFADHIPPGFTAWGMMLNDTLGDCTIAACGHALQIFTQGSITEPDSTIETYYEKWCGYVAGDPSTDQGGVETVVLGDWQSGGFAGHVLDGYVTPTPQDWSHVMHSIAEFGGIYLGLQLPNSAVTQNENGQVWDVVKNDGGIAGGHAVFCPAYHTEDPTYNKETTITAITWGMKQKMTQAFWDRYVDESHTLLAAAWQPAGVNLAALRADLAFMTN